MNATVREIIRRNSRRARIRKTRTQAVLRNLEGIEAVLFDVYGTLFISASGDIGGGDSHIRSRAFVEALGAVHVQSTVSGADGDKRLTIAIQESQVRSREEGVDYPEVDIVAVWRTTLERLAGDGLVKLDGITEERLQRLAVEHEVRANPVWPMPHAKQCLRRLRGAGLTLGLVSNAQFFTPELFPALMGATVEQLGFAADLQFYSYRFGRAKPGLFLYEQASEALSAQGIRADETLYVGNDMRNDILAASRVGFRTALFAGDARSLKLRVEDDRVAGTTPDVILTDLSQLPVCLAASS